MVYCAGVMMAVTAGENGARQLQRLSRMLGNCYGGQPYMAMHPFGEQGFNTFRNRTVHGNLMFSSLVFSLDPDIKVEDSDADEIGELLDHCANLSDSSAATMRMMKEIIFSAHTMDFNSLAVYIANNQISAQVLLDLVL